MRIVDIVEWVEKNRKGKAFSGFSREQIEQSILTAVENNCLVYDVDGGGNLCGVILVEPRLHISQILTTKKSSFGALVRTLLTKVPGITLQAMRKNKLKVYPRKWQKLTLVEKV